MSDDVFVIRVNQFTNGATGHSNLTYLGGGVNETYGNNLAPSLGVQREDSENSQRIARNPSAYSYVDVRVTADQFISH